ncbi:ciliated left-right organizer metallopeptidase [Cololabis saira]|uniref:ciliated left-right organizer metallopeptidase n=1 Tax=Cololabis saira TaxID=129043 RepID=UPI002AD40F6C|nr:ciliated left-right organizer metallopeptidase [Cololabis saira]
MIAFKRQVWWMQVAVIALVLELPGSLHMCIFDEAQAQLRVVRASPPPEPRFTDRQEGLLTFGQKPRHPGLALKSRRSFLGKSATPPSSRPQPIRIKIWTPAEIYAPSEAENRRVEAAVEEAVRVVSSLLQPPCYRQIPDEHLAGCDVYPEADSPGRIVLRSDGSGLPDTDFLLYLHIQATDKCRAKPNVLAYAVHCQTDSQGRPVAGVVVVCRDRLTGAAYSHQATVQTVIHELFHALGFSKDLFSSWRVCSPPAKAGALCSPRGKVTHSDGSGQKRIYTASVISALQRHLVSNDPELGGPLENWDASADGASSHWESRVLQGSIMTAVLGDPITVRIDSVTLAALQDTGWYTVDLSRAQNLVWGDGEGTTFGSLSTCKNGSSSFFCTGSGRGCHFLHLHKGECQTDQYLEGCRIYKSLKNGSECWKTENSKWSAEDDGSGEVFGFDSRCFFSSLVRQRNSPRMSSSVEGRCYRHMCTGLNNFQIQVSGSGWVDCPAGSTIQIKGYQGAVLCPDRRLCLYSDVTPPSEDDNPPPCITCDALEAFTSAPSVSPSQLRLPAEVTAATGLCSVAGACFLALLLVSYRKCRTCMVRIRTVAPESHSEL